MFMEIILLLLTCLLVVKLHLIHKKPPGTPPGTNGLPLIGVLPGRNETFQHFINSYQEKYGNILWLKLGSLITIHIRGHEDITAAFANPALQGRINFFSTQLMYKYGEKDPQRRESYITDHLGILFSAGEHWKNVRRFIIRRLRDGGMGKSSAMEGIILREAEALVEDFGKHVGKPTEIPWSVNASILNVVWELVGSQRYDVSDKEIQQLFSDINDTLGILQDGLFLLDIYPGLARLIPNFITNYFGKKTFEIKMDRVYEQMHKAVEDHKKTLDVDNPRDLIDSYLIELKNSEDDSPKKSDFSSTFSERELAQSVFDLFLAGSETTSSTVKWFIFYMAKFADIQKRVHEEIDIAIPKDGTVSFADKEKLPFFESCICEALRLKSILPFGLPHVATEDTELGGYVIPKGSHIFANLIACHRDPKLWKEPNKYYPEHFLNEDGSFNSSKQGLIPFSTGRRVCLGENLAKMDLFLLLASIMKNFRFTVPDGEIMSEDVLPNQPWFTLPMPFKIIINKREN